MRRRTAAAAALLGVVSLAACGIQQSDVVEAGGAATVAVNPPPEFRMVLYFLGPDGRPTPVARDDGRLFPDPSSAAGVSESEEDRKTQALRESHGTSVATDKVLAALLAGPADADRAAGLTTGLPAAGTSGFAPHAEPIEEAGVTAEGRRILRVRTSFPVMNLSDAAVQQLVCTVAYAEDGGGMAEVTLAGEDGTLPATRCER
ncbi:hypothetical protein [Streptomyces sp. NPDC002825]|uniref:hypothetical protein n=1 Tax=Streptomyces sp. NPDC002825 TaxID=3154666 RepID=UPI00331B6043